MDVEIFPTWANPQLQHKTTQPTIINFATAQQELQFRLSSRQRMKILALLLMVLAVTTFSEWLENSSRWTFPAVGASEELTTNFEREPTHTTTKEKEKNAKISTIKS